MRNRRYRPRFRNRSLWVDYLKRPQRWFLGWFVGPKLSEKISSFRASILDSGVHCGGGSYRDELKSPELASLDNLRVATTDSVMWIPLSHIRSARAQIFSSDEHPFVRFFDEGYEGMKECFLLDQPKTLFEYFGIKEFRTTTNFSASTLSRVWPWSPSVQLIPEPPIFPYWRAGPKSDSHLTTEARRLHKLLKSVQKNGFVARQGDLPLYLLLIDDCGGVNDNFRAVVFHGNHRVALLAHLGWTMIPMAPPDSLAGNEIRLSDAVNWPGVLDGSFTLEDARAVFMSFFRVP